MLKKIGVFLCISMYLIVSQFVFKAVATTEIAPIDFETDTVCYGKILDTYESKRSCRKTSFMTETGVENISLEHKKTLECMVYPLQPTCNLFVTAYHDKLAIYGTDPPPYGYISWIKKYKYIGAVKLVV